MVSCCCLYMIKFRPRLHCYHGALRSLTSNETRNGINLSITGANAGKYLALFFNSCTVAVSSPHAGFGGSGLGGCTRGGARAGGLDARGSGGGFK